MEKQLFSWKDWDVIGTMAFQFYNVVLVKQIGPYPIGTEFGSAYVDYEKSELAFYDEYGEMIGQPFDLKLEVVPQC